MAASLELAACRSNPDAPTDTTTGPADTSTDRRSADTAATPPADSAHTTSEADPPPGDSSANDADTTKVDRRTRGLRTPPDYLSNCEPVDVSQARRKTLGETKTCLGDGRRLFRDATAESGLAVRHDFPEYARQNAGYGYDIGAGVVLEDFTDDGWLDVYLTGGSGANRLFFNKGGGQFVECTDYAGVGLEDDWTNGASAADIDNDGDQDLYVANSGPDRLLRNDGDGTFTDVSASAGIEQPGRSSTASWGDIDNDGDLDLFVASLLEQEGTMPTHRNPGGDASPPDPVPSALYRNRGDGTFEEVSDTLPNSRKLARASFLGPLVDLNGDQRVDLLLTAEFTDSILWENAASPEAPLRFVDRTKSASLTLDAPMGLDVLDANGDGRPDLSASTLWGGNPVRESLLENRGDFRFKDTADARGAHAMIQGRHTRVVRAASWGVGTFDVENDGDDDLYFAYGKIDYGRSRGSQPFFEPAQPNSLLLNDGDGYFTAADGACVEDHGQSRGLAYGDVNGDGCVDLIVANQEGSSRLFLNRCVDSGAFLELRLRGTRSTRDAVGARVTVHTDGQRQTKQVLAGSRGVHSSSPKRLHFGIGDAGRVESVEIRWPSGKTQTLRRLIPGGLIRIQEPL